MTQLTAKPYSLKLRIPYIWAKGVQHERRGLIITCKHADGTTQRGEVAPPPHDVPSNEQLLKMFHEAIEGLDPSSKEFLSQLDARFVNSRIRCGISSAWVRNWQRKKAVPVNGLITGNEVEEQIKLWQSVGIGSFKVKVGAKLDLERIKRIRSLIGPSSELRLDANESWDYESAKKYLNLLAPLAISYIEQPLPANEIEKMVKLQKLSPIDLALDEAATDSKAIKELLEKKAGRVVILKPQRLGGPDRTLSAIKTAEALGAKVTITNSLESSVGVHAALSLASYLKQPTPCGLATSHYLAEELFPPPIIKKGLIYPTTLN